MERSEYYDDTIPTQDQLNHTEDSRANAILHRFQSTVQMGVESGFQVQPGHLDKIGRAHV
jgi:hypothetical protein